MALTPDDITQKFFATRFRGVDPEEVKEFLGLVAAQLTELQDRLKQQSEQIARQEKELALAADDKKSFDDVLDVFKQKIDTLTAQLDEARQRETSRAEELELAKQLVDGVQQERDSLKAELGRAQTTLSEAESKSRMSRAAIEGLRNKIVVIEAEKAELMSEAEQVQKVAAEARHQSDELLEEGKHQAELMITAAQEEIARLRDAASLELRGIREDIDKLNAQRRQLHTDLRDLLHGHLDRLSEYVTGAVGPSRSEYDELFQKIDFAELSELEEIGTQGENSEGPVPAEEEAGDSEETLRSQLQDGGIAYLSDE